MENEQNLTKQDVNAIVDNAANTALAIKAETKEIVRVYTNQQETKDDFDHARSTVNELLDEGTTALTDLLAIAKNSEHPRAYEVAATLIKNLGETAEKLINIQKSMRELEFMEELKANQEDKSANTTATSIGNITINNVDKAVFTGSTTDFIAELEKEDTDYIDVEVMPVTEVPVENVGKP